MSLPAAVVHTPSASGPLTLIYNPAGRVATLVLVDGRELHHHAHAEDACARVYVWFSWDTLIAFAPRSGRLPADLPGALLNEAGVLSGAAVSARFIAAQQVPPGGPPTPWVNVGELKRRDGRWAAFERDAARIRAAVARGPEEAVVEMRRAFEAGGL